MVNLGDCRGEKDRDDVLRGGAREQGFLVMEQWKLARARL